MNKLLYIDERPDRHCVVKGLSNLVKVSRHQMLIKSSTKTQHLVKTSRIQRQLIADKGSFDRGLARPCAGYHKTSEDKAGPPRATFRAALPERRINVDRVSIDDVLQRLSLPEGFGARHRGKPGFELWGIFNTDSYSRCFRYLDCFVMLMRDSAWDVPVGLLSTGCMVTAPIRGCGLNGSGQRAIAEARLSGGESGQHYKAVSIPSNLDRQLKDNQGGCLYEWPTYNQNQALTTPVNLVGGAVMRTIPVCREVPLTTL